MTGRDRRGVGVQHAHQCFIHTHTLLRHCSEWTDLWFIPLLWIITFSPLPTLPVFLPLSHQALQQLGVFQSSLPHRPLGRAQSSPAATVNPIKHLFTTGQFLCVFLKFIFISFVCVHLWFVIGWEFDISGVSPPTVSHHACCLATVSWLCWLTVQMKWTNWNPTNSWKWLSILANYLV